MSTSALLPKPHKKGSADANGGGGVRSRNPWHHPVVGRGALTSILSKFHKKALFPLNRVALGMWNSNNPQLSGIRGFGPKALLLVDMLPTVEWCVVPISTWLHYLGLCFTQVVAMARVEASGDRRGVARHRSHLDNATQQQQQLDDVLATMHSNGNASDQDAQVTR